MSYQHQILPENASLEIKVQPEAGGYWTLRYRCVDDRFAHRDDWRVVEHLTVGELEDVAGAVLDGFRDDFEAQGLF